MRLRNALDSILGSVAKVRVLRVLISPGLELTGREVAAEAGLSVQTCARALQDLVNVGLLDMTKRGRAHLYRLRNEYYLVRHGLAPLLHTERSLFERAVQFLRERFESQVVSAVLFGSYAREEEGEHSDFDVFFLVGEPDDVSRLDQDMQSASGGFHQLFGVMLTPYVKHLQEFQEMVRERVPITREIATEGRLLFGKPIARGRS